MLTTRRAFVAALAALPVVGRIVGPTVHAGVDVATGADSTVIQCGRWDVKASRFEEQRTIVLPAPGPAYFSRMGYPEAF